MNRSKKIIVVIINFIIVIMGCTSMDREDIDLEKRDNEFEEKMIKKSHPYYFYRAIYRNDVDIVKRFLEAGSDPNKCWGENGWVDSNPLKVVAESFYNTYDFRNDIPKTISGTVSDVAVIQLLVDTGADINRLPYIWDRVNRYGNERYENTLYRRKLSKLTFDPDAVQAEMDTFLRDANRVLVALLEAGADPDKLGHPFPFGYDWKVPFLTNKRANKYFEHGTRAINVAIEKGIVWESQVDLLLQYTTLDKESLNAAERSNDPAMIGKINHLWKEQQKRNVNK